MLLYHIFRNFWVVKRNDSNYLLVILSSMYYNLIIDQINGEFRLLILHTNIDLMIGGNVK